MYQELLVYARRQATIQSEFTSDNRMVKEEKKPSGQGAKLAAMVRFWFVKHFRNLTPQWAAVLQTKSDHLKVLFTAFTGRVNGNGVHTYHIANLGDCNATITGLPYEIKSLRPVRMSETEAFKKCGPASVANGVAKLELARQVAS